ncbi:hypothetical protein [Rubritalea halochordaticola]
MRLIFEPDTLSQTEQGSVTGVIYFDFGEGQTYPGTGWSDFALVLAGWWMSAVKELEQGECKAKLLFMDGPFEIHLFREGDDQVLMRCMPTRSKEQIDLRLGLDVLKQEIQRTAREVAHACDAANLHARAIRDLEHLNDLLKL